MNAQLLATLHEMLPKPEKPKAFLLTLDFYTGQLYTPAKTFINTLTIIGQHDEKILKVGTKIWKNPTPASFTMAAPWDSSLISFLLQSTLLWKALNHKGLYYNQSLALVLETQMEGAKTFSWLQTILKNEPEINVLERLWENACRLVYAREAKSFKESEDDPTQTMNLHVATSFFREGLRKQHA